MSYQNIKEGLEIINSTTSWSLALISYNHKSRPGEFTCHSINFQTDELLKKTISEMCTSFISIIDNSGKLVEDYNGTNSKNAVEKIPVSNFLIASQWNKLINSLNDCDDSVELKDIKPQAYIFAGTYTVDNQDQNVYLLSRRNPIYTYKKGKGKIFESRQNRIQEISEPLIQFGKTIDAIIYKGVLYSINNNFESIFNMEYSHKIACKASLETIENKSIIDDFENYKAFALSGQHPRKFLTFDKRILDNIQEEANLDILTQQLKIPYDRSKGKFILSEEKHAQIFTKAICGKTKYNMFIDGVCEVPNSIPLNIS